ncbi:insulinase family protein [Bowmanella sp. Y26]|uniref:M16 family metallopeptidase n=1 Tax=Bowmanella yangjiangensis TaxID=2811230 RepID=UPI001BDD7775|nr:pitrilysin family protein [Bowmanella yangjiangensis]MBT1063826.1 insulinase family protein [Bowmanella yangjiangensis]
MNKIYKVIGCISLVCISLGSWAAGFSLPKYEKVTLQNGLTLYLMEQHEVPLIDLVVTVKAGAVDDSKAGLAKLTAANLILGTQQLPRAELEAKLDFIGAQLDADAELEYSSVSASLASKDLDQVLQWVKDSLLTPAFDDQEFAKHKQRYLANLQQKTESPKAVIKDYFNAQLFKGHPYAAEIDGSNTSVAGISLADVKAFHKRWYTPDNTAVIVAGDFDTKQLKSKLSKLFATWQGKAPARAKLTTPVQPKQAQVLLVDKPDAVESTFMIGGAGMAMSNPDYVAVSVINTILGGRFTSWLNDELRVNSGLTYGARSRFESHQQGGSFYISTFTKTDTTKQAIDLALQTYQKLWKQGIDQSTLDSAKAYVKGQFPPNYETSAQLASLMSDMFIYGFDEDFINGFSERVNALTVDKSQSLIEQYFPSQNLQFVVVGQAEIIKDWVKGYGQLQQVNIQDSE